MGGEDRGRDSIKGSGRSFRSRSRSRSRARQSKSETDVKPIGKRIKGMIKGMSRRNKNSSDGCSATDSVAASTTISIHQTEDNKTVKTAPESPVNEEMFMPKAQPSNAQTTSLQLVLLLMDPATRRFELLQLEFDSDKARVSDILAQIPVSVTEEAIRYQQYEGVLDESAEKMDESVRLVDFCYGKKVLVALPRDLPVRECMRLARPILCDLQVEKMLEASGFDISGWAKKTESQEDVQEEIKTRELPIVEAEPSKEATPKKKERTLGSIVFPMIAVLTLLAIAIEAAHNFISAPIEIGVPLPPGTWRSKCGFRGYLPKLEFLPPCTDTFLEVNHDGTVYVYDEDQELDMTMVGDVCNDEDCVEGLVMNKDRTISIGGRIVKSATLYGVEYASLWPFKEEPKMKMKRLNAFSSPGAANLAKK